MREDKSIKWIGKIGWLLPILWMCMVSVLIKWCELVRLKNEMRLYGRIKVVIFWMTYDLIHPDWCLVDDEINGNISVNGHNHIRGRLYLTYCSPLNVSVIKHPPKRRMDYSLSTSTVCQFSCPNCSHHWIVMISLTAQIMV